MEYSFNFCYNGNYFNSLKSRSLIVNSFLINYSLEYDRDGTILEDADNPIMSTQWSSEQLLAMSVYWSVDQTVTPEGFFFPQEFRLVLTTI